jgi:hypothetical protein
MRTPRALAAAINPAVSVSRSKGKYSATRLPAANIGNRMTARAARSDRKQ